MSLKKVTLFLLVSGFSLALNAQTAKEILADYIVFTGGEQQWKKIHSINVSGIYNYGGLEFPFESFSKSPNLYKYIVSSNGKYFAQAFDGIEGWKIDGFKDETKKTILKGKNAMAMANEADVELESAFINYQSKGHQALFEGKDTIDNTICFKVKFIRTSGDTETYFFSTADFSLIKKQAVSKNTELDNSTIDIYYSNYKTVKGIKIPFQSVCKIKDQVILTITLQNAKLNTAIKNKDFKP